MNLRRAFLAAVAAVLFLCLTPSDAEARRRGGFGGQPAARTFGIGLILLSPTGLSMELKLGPRSALDLAIGLDMLDDDDDGLLHFDYLVYLTDFGGGSLAAMPYLGIGGIIWEHNHPGDDDDLHFGIRVPFGLALAMRTAPVQFFLEGAIRILLHDDYDGPGDDDDSDVDLTFGLGFRVYF